jgi:single-strand DNA-binding protein
MSDTSTTISGNLTQDPSLNHLPSGSPVVTLSVAVNTRWLNRQTGTTEEAVGYYDLSVFGELAEHCAETLRKGDRILATGRLDQQRWDDSTTGAKRSKIIIKADDVAVSLRWANAAITKARTPAAVGAGATEDPAY